MTPVLSEALFFASAAGGMRLFEELLLELM